MDRWKQDLSHGARLIGLTAVTWVGGWLFITACVVNSGWRWLPAVCGFPLLLVGTVARLLAVFRPLIDLPEAGSEASRPFAPHSFAVPAPPPPPPPPSASERTTGVDGEDDAGDAERSSGKSRRKSARKKS